MHSAGSKALGGALAVWLLAVSSAAAAPGPPVCLGRCTGDCNANGAVAVNEILTLVNVTLGEASTDTCANADALGLDDLDIGDVVIAVRNALDGCPQRSNLDVCGCAPQRDPTVFFGSFSLLTDVAFYSANTLTADPNDPQPSCGCAGGRTAWIRLKPEHDGIATFDVRSDAFTPSLAVFAGTCGSDDELACAREPGATPRVSVPVSAGADYLVQVATCEAADGEFSLKYDLCGDGYASIAEQCDDGNTADGDGCSSACVDEQLGGIDQQWTGPRDVSCGVAAGSPAVGGRGIEGQPFVPTRPDLAAVDVLLNTYRVRGESPDIVTLNVRAGSHEGPVVGTATATVSGTTGLEQFWLRYSFSPPLTLTPGAQYVLDLVPRRQGFFWYYSTTDDSCPRPEPGYPGSPFAVNFFFRTFGARTAQ